MYDTSLIKQRISCVDIAQRYGLPIRQSGDRCVSPLRPGASNPSSFAVDTDFWYDFGSGNGGDQIDLQAELYHHGDRGAAIRELARLTGVANDNEDDTHEWRTYTEQLNAMAAYYHTQLTEDDKSYLRSRGITDADSERLMIGRVTDGALRGRLFLPYFTGTPESGGYVSYYATRSLPGGAFPDNKYMKQKRDSFCKHIPWGMQTLSRGGDTLIIAEGYFDAASFECSNYPVLSAITGRFSRDQIPTVLAAARKFSQVFIVYDNDTITHAGDSFAQTMAEILTRNRIPFIVGTVPMPYHDISEYYAAGGDLSRIIATAEPGVEYIATRIKDFAELEKFIYTVARHTKRTATEELFAKLRKLDRWNDKALTALYKAATTAPPENIVADEILKSHQLVYIPDVGFYEYFRGVWTRINDGIIKYYADQAYGEFSSAQRVNAICNLAKVRALRTDVQFDKQPVWNFINGTLELETGVFRDPNPNDYCSMQVSYPYNPDATYDAWNQFIDDVTAGDPRAAELLQLYAGYVFEPTNKYEKVLTLSGTGGNGKTRYLEILRQLFRGSDNAVSHLTPRGLLDRFQAIQLRESIVNIAGEIRSDIRDTEERIKSIASGEPLSACYKGQDFITFPPRTKLIFATNNQLASGDTSEGMTRRLLMVDFKVSFVDNPDPSDPYQRKKNVDILDHLNQELRSGGIFNWAYAGYQLLRAVGYFTETADQTQLIQEFKRASNPVLVFWEDNNCDFGEEITNKDLYWKYLQWCGDNGEKPQAAQGFYREFKRVSDRDYEPYRTNKERGYRRVTAESAVR